MELLPLNKGSFNIDFNGNTHILLDAYRNLLLKTIMYFLILLISKKYSLPTECL